MLKLGIVRPEDLERPYTRLGQLRHASLLLLRDLTEPKRERPAAYDALLARVRMPNGTWRATAPGRLGQIDTLVLRHLRRQYRRQSHLTVIDLAASTGVTSLELYDRLGSDFSVEFIASDLYRDLLAVRAPDLGWTVIVDCFGNEVQYIIGRFVLPGQLSESLALPVNRVLKAVARRVLSPRARAIALRLSAEKLDYFVPRVIRGCEVQRLPFVSFRCLELLRSDPHFRFEIIDVTQRIPLRANVIRAMNIVTADNFNVPVARTVIANCVSALEPGGLLVMGRSCGLSFSPGDVHATIYLENDGRLTPIDRLNGGDEVEALVAEMKERVCTAAV